MTSRPEPIRTARLDLIAGDANVLRAELTGRESLEAALGISIPRTWPPELYDAHAVEWMLARLGEDSGFEAWGFRYFALRGSSESETPVAIGAGGYKGPPTSEGTVEIGYSILAEYRRRGFASEAVGGLLEHAYAHGDVTKVIAETLPGLEASIGVLKKSGFEPVGDGSQSGVIRFAHLKASLPSVE